VALSRNSGESSTRMTGSAVSEGVLNPTNHGSLISEYQGKPVIQRDSIALDVPQDSPVLRPLGLEAQRLSRSLSGSPVRRRVENHRSKKAGALGLVGPPVAQRLLPCAAK
jgi:hypothetical protein